MKKLNKTCVAASLILFAAGSFGVFADETATRYPGFDYEVGENDFDNITTEQVISDSSETELKVATETEEAPVPAGIVSEIGLEWNNGTAADAEFASVALGYDDEPSYLGPVENFGIGQRYVEIRTNVGAGVSNNYLSLDKILTDEIVIDLPEIARKMPFNGLSFDATADAAYEINLNFRKLKLGYQVKVDADVNCTIERSIFEFLGNGNKLGEEVRFGVSTTDDVFFAVEVPFMFNVGQLSIYARPSVFAPIIHAETENVGVSLQNTEDAKFIAKMGGNVYIYTPVSKERLEAKDYVSDLDKILNGIGFDLGLGGSYPLFNFLTVRGNASIPIVPGKLQSRMGYLMDTTFEVSGQDLIAGNLPTPNMSFDPVFQECIYRINRPLKFSAGADFMPLGHFVDLFSDIGFGVRYPFSPQAKFFMEYKLGGTLNLGNVLVVTLSHEYIDQLFHNSALFALNLRVLELDLGIETQSSNFGSAFAISGAAVSVGFAMGF